MRMTKKLIGMSAILASVSAGAVMAQDAKVTDVPASMEDSRAVESGELKKVETFTEEKMISESAETTNLAETGDEVTTEVDSTGVPASLADSRLAEATDIEGMSADSRMYIWTMSEVEGVSPWADEDAKEMRAAILANTAVKSSLEAEGYSESDVVAAYTRADGGLTVVVN